LRIEASGIVPESLPQLDFTDFKYRRIYFLRRAIVTLTEVAEAFRMLDVDQDFESVKNEFDNQNMIRWKRVVKFFKRFEPELRRVRNDIGGHFGHHAARYAIQNMESSIVGQIELSKAPPYDGPDKVGVKLHFAGDIVAKAMQRHSSMNSAEQYVIRRFASLLLAIHCQFRQSVLSTHITCGIDSYKVLRRKLTTCAT
jgi:hypothetical protein